MMGRGGDVDDEHADDVDEKKNGKPPLRSASFLPFSPFVSGTRQLLKQTEKPNNLRSYL